MAKLVSQLMKVKPNLLNSNYVQKQLTNSISFSGSGIFFKHRLITDDCGNVENILHGKVENIFSFLKYPIPNTNTDDDINVAVENINLPHYFKHARSLEIGGHSHGIICLFDDSDSCKDIMLYNPATTAFRQLPPAIFDVTREHFVESVKFGYDPKSNDFKVVRVFNLVEDTYHDRFVIDQQIEVYDLSIGKWREIIAPAPRFDMWEALCGNLYHDGVFYQFNDETILGFDISREVFREIPLPNISLEDFDHFQSLIDVWNGSIVLVSKFTRDRNSSFFEIWAMDESHSQSDGVSWSKVFTIGHLSGIMRPLLFVNSDEIIMEADDGQVISYHLKTKELKNLPVKGVRFWSQCIIFQKSEKDPNFL